MEIVEMVVSLKVPDNVAKTAFNTLQRVGFGQLKGLERSHYYQFEINGDTESFKKDISKADILINANKNQFSFSLEKSNKKNIVKNTKIKKISILVQDFDDDKGLLSTLKDRLGFKNIKKMEKGVLWIMHFDEDVNARNIAVDIAKNLLMNENYQKFRLLF
jgi:phosphoribosylformylglycinamidine (FGAM) synthase PurS component